MHTAYIGIGSNLGNREENCEESVRRLKARGVEVLAGSRMYETDPWGIKDQPRFINMVVMTRTGLSPRELLHLLKEIESDMGREQTFHWGPRKIDLDILLYNDLAVNEPGLVIPHPHMHERDFVLKPLAEIAADVVHPVLNKTIKELKETVM